jgi:phosphate transport system substrate-binding protein
LYHALEGVPPYDGPTFAAVIAAVIEQPAPPPPRHAGPLGDLLGRLLAKDPGRRDDAETAARELARLRPGPVAGNLSPQAVSSGPTAVLGSDGGQATLTHVMSAAAPGRPASGLGAGQAAPGPGSGQGWGAPGPPGQPPNRRRLLAGGAAAVALIVVASVGVYLATKPHSSGLPATSGGSSPAGHSRTGSPAAGSGPSGTAATTASTAPQCATGSLQIFGSSAFQNIVQLAANAYVKACPNTIIGINKNITGQDSALGVSTVETAVEVNSPSAKSMIAMYDGTTSSGPRLAQHPLGVLIYAVVAHKGLFSGSKVTSTQLVKIFVNHGDPSKVVVGRKPGSATHLTFFTKVLHAKTGLADVNKNDSASVIDYVGKTRNAIGYAVALPASPQVSLLAIGNAQPSKADVLNGSYKFWAVEHLYTASQPSALTKDFLDYLPRYIQSHSQADFITCSDVAGAAGASC